MSDPPHVRFAVVGATGYSRSHLMLMRELAARDGGCLIASMMIDKADHPELVAGLEAVGVQVFDDYTEMLHRCRGLVDVITLPVPIYLHAPMTVEALEAGYHVLVEKPVAGSLAEVDQMIAARDAAGLTCAVGFQQIYSPAFQSFKDYLMGGRLGRIRRIAIAALWPRPPAYYARNQWAGKLTCDGRPVFDSPFNNALAHQIMNMLFLASSVRNTAAQVAEVQAELYRAYDIESFDTGCMRAFTQEGVELVFAATHACETTLDPVMHLEAEHGHAHWRIGGDVTVHHVDGTETTIREDEPRIHMMLNVADAVSGQIALPHCTLEMGRAHVACIDALHRSAEIRSVPDRLVSTVEAGQRVIAGIDQAVRGVLDSGKLFSELGASLS